MRSLKQLLHARTPTLGSWLSLASPEAAEILARAGFDWLVVDMEHTPTTAYQAQQLIRVVELSGLAPLVRVAENHPTAIKHALEAGAHGVIVPMVNTAKQARAAVSAAKYPPEGTRGVGLGRAQGYGASFDAYRDWLGREGVVVVQIEHIQAVERLDEILAVEGVDAFMVGPYDLSGSLGLPGQFDHPTVLDAMARIDRAVRGGAKAAGWHVVQPDSGLLFQKLDAGYSFLAFGGDMLFLNEIVRERVAQTRKWWPDEGK